MCLQEGFGDPDLDTSTLNVGPNQNGLTISTARIDCLMVQDSR